MFTHPSEAIADAISAVEAIYMTKNRKGYYNQLDNRLLPLPQGSEQEEYVLGFIEKYSNKSVSDIDPIKKLNPYRIRSGYLHNGERLIPAPDFNISPKKYYYLEEVKIDSLIINLFFDFIYETIRNFILNDQK
jgi:hypothetical protein